MKKRLITLFVAVLLALALAPALAFADDGHDATMESVQDPIVLNSISINLTCGAAPDRGTKLTFDGAEIPAGLIMDTSNSYFYMRPDRTQSGNHFYTDGICNSGTIYGVQIALFVMDGYKISPTAKFYLNSQPINNVRTANPDGTLRYIFGREFSRTRGVSTMITAGLIHDLAQPIAGKTPRQQWGSLAGEGDIKFQVTTLIDDTTGANVVEVAQMYFKKLDALGNEVSMSADEPFVTDGRYRIKLLLSPQHWVGGTYYEMGSTFTITVNGTDITGPASTSGGFAFNYDFAPVTSLDEARATVVTPEVGAAPSFAVTIPDNAHYTASVSWAETHDGAPITTFGNNRYTAYVTFYANDGFSFINAFDMQQRDSVTINGQKAARKAHDPQGKWITFEVSFFCGDAPDWVVEEVAIIGVPSPTPGDALTWRYLGFNSSETAKKAFIDTDNTYFAYWNPSTKSWFMMNEGDIFREGVLYKVQVSIQARYQDGYQLHPDATGNLRHSKIDTPVIPEVQFNDGNHGGPSMERLFLTLTFNDNECPNFGGHRYTDRWHSSDNPSEYCLDCGYRYGDVNHNGTVNIVDAQIAYDLATHKGNYESRSDYAALVNRADVVGGPTPRSGDKGTPDANDALAIQYAALRGWNN